MGLGGLRILKETMRQSGWKAAGKLLVDRVGARVANLTVTQVVWLPVENVKVEDPGWEGWEFRFLSTEEIKAYSSDPACDLPAGIEERIEKRGDFCFGCLDRGKLAAYGWYALKEIEPEHCFGFGMRFGEEAAYMYKGYTHEDYRGKRLHGIGMGLALKGLGKVGVRALVSTVNWTNEASLKSCWRLGYEPIGNVVMWGWGGKRWMKTPRKARSLGVSFVAERRESSRIAEGVSGNLNAVAAR